MKKDKAVMQVGIATKAQAEDVNFSGKLYKIGFLLVSGASKPVIGDGSPRPDVQSKFSAIAMTIDAPWSPRPEAYAQGITHLGSPTMRSAISQSRSALAASRA
jgi:hypothetical protein